MNAKLTLCLVAITAALPMRAQDGPISVEDLPQAVQQTLSSRAEGDIEEVTRRTIDGRALYIVEIDRDNAPNPRLRIAEDGTMMGTSEFRPSALGDYATVPGAYPHGPVAMPVFPKLRLSDLSEAVQRTAKVEAKGREIADIERETWRGQPVYEIEFKERGLNSRVYVGEDGALVRDEWRPGETLRSLFMGTQVEDTPVPVQETIRRVAGDGEVADIDLKTSGAEPVYRVEIRRKGERQELHVAADGTTLFDSRTGGEPVRD